MIFNRLEDAERLEKLHPGFAAAFAFLRRPDLAELPAGRQEIDGSRVYAVVFRRQGKGKAGTKLEIHRQYIDIQHTVTGTDLIGWTPAVDLKQPEQPFNEEKDVQFFLDAPNSWVDTPAGSFGIFFPEDGHAPQATAGPIHKVVVKVAVDWTS
jgi:YhcH/YjgK/YiaL family protein